MKAIILAVTLILLICTTAAANTGTPYCVAGIVWDEDGNLEEGIQISLTYAGQTHTTTTADDGSFVFSTLNFDRINDGDTVDVSCKYGTKTVELNYVHSYMSGLKMVHICQYGVGVTFNEPSQSAAIAAFAALGLIAIPIGHGIYRLFKKKED